MKVIYSGLFLTEEARRRSLMKLIEIRGQGNEIAHKNAKDKEDGFRLHHMTSQFFKGGIDHKDVPGINHLGEEVYLHVIGHTADEKIQAFVCNDQMDSIQPEMKSTNANPHITISFAEGASPVDVNKSITKNGYVSLQNPFFVVVRFGIFVNGSPVFEIDENVESPKIYTAAKGWHNP